VYQVLDNAETDLTAYFEDCFQFINAVRTIATGATKHTATRTLRTMCIG
jgi:hypothetical protein